MSKLKSIGFGCLMVFSCFLFNAAVLAQSATATLSGTVVDDPGNLIPGASVTISNNATGLQRQTVTDGEGNFVIPLLPPGNYTITVQRAGFTPAEIREVILNTNDQRSLQIQLKVGAVGASVTVTNEAQLVDESPAVSTTVDRQFVENMPLNGRTLQSLILITPGAVVGGGDGQISINGQRTNSNYYTIDGASANIGVSGGGTATAISGSAGRTGNSDQNASGANPGFNSFGGTNGLISLEALEEFKIQSSTYSASFGRQPGGQVQLTSRSGTNAYRGTLFEYFRNDALDANDFFTNALNAIKTPLRQNNFGGVLGGPIRIPKIYDGRDKTFFFVSYEGLRLAQPQPTTELRVPAAFLHNDAALHPTLRAIIAAYPLPTRCPATDPEGRISGACFFTDATSVYSNLDAFSVKFDQKIGENHSLFGRYNYAPSSSKTLLLASETINEVRTQTLTLGARSAFTSKLLNEVTFNYSTNVRSGFTNLTNRLGVQPFSTDILQPPDAPNLLSFSYGLPGGVSSYLPGRFRENQQIQYNIIDNFTWIAGNHSLRFGVDYRRLTPIYASQELRALFNLFSIAALTNPATKSDPPLNLVRTFASERVQLELNNFSLYGQDSWKVNRRLTLEFGLRWEINSPPRVIQGEPFAVLSGLDLNNFTLQPRGTALYPTIWNSFAPRFGAAYLLRESNNWLTQLRGGVGVFYDLGIGTTATSALQFPHNRQYTAPAGTRLSALPGAFLTPPPLDLNGGTVFPNQDFTFVDPDYVLPRTYQWSFSVDQGLGKDQTLTLSYVGNAGRRLLRRYFAIGSSTHPRFPGAGITITRNDPGFADSSDYNALQLQFQRRLSRGFQILANYTLARAIDTGSSDSEINLLTGNNAAAPEFYRGFSDFDRRHVFNVAATYEIPTPWKKGFAKALLGGWATDFNFKYQSAAPLTVTYGYLDRDFILRSYRADLVPGIPVWLDDSTAPGGRRLNPAAFTLPAAAQAQLGRTTLPVGGNPAQADFTQFNNGSAERNSLRGFDLAQLDFVARRTFKLTERVNLQFRAEFFNALNRPNFAQPATAFAGLVPDSSVPGSPLRLTFDPRFGRVTNTLGRSLSQSGSSPSAGALSQIYQIGGPRSIQFALRLSF